MATATIKKKTGDWFAETESVTLVLTAEEAAAIFLMVGSAVGPSESSPRRHAESIWDAMNNSMPRLRRGSDIHRAPQFMPGDIRDYFE